MMYETWSIGEAEDGPIRKEENASKRTKVKRILRCPRIATRMLKSARRRV